MHLSRISIWLLVILLVRAEDERCSLPSTKTSRRLSLKTKENGLLIITDNDSQEMCGSEHTNSADAKPLPQVSECCFDWLDSSPATQRAINVTITSENALEKDMIDRVLSNSSYREFTRKDKLPFYASFDVEVDQYSLRRDSKSYNLTKRFQMITDQTVNMDAPLRPFLGATFNSSQSFAGGEGSLLSSQLASDSTWIYGGGKGLKLHTRFSFGETKIHVLKGSIALIVTPASDVHSLRTFPSTHALHDQSQIDFVQERNYKVPAQIFYVKAGQMAVIPVFTGFRLICLEDDTIWSVSDYFEASAIIQARQRATKLIPRYLQPNALSGQPLFFGMWSLAIYADGLLGFMENRTEERSRAKSLRALIETRWGQSSIRLGHVDDPRDFGLEAEEVMESIELECAEMAQTAKDLMLSERNKVEEEILRAAWLTRNELLKATGSNAHTQNLFDVLAVIELEQVISNVLGGAGIRAFLSCYWGMTL